MPAGDSGDPICLSSDSDEDTRPPVRLSAAAKGKGRALPEEELDALHGVDHPAEDQMGNSGAVRAPISIDGTYRATPVNPTSPSFLDVRSQSVPARPSSHTRSAVTSLGNQQEVDPSRHGSVPTRIATRNPPNPPALPQVATSTPRRSTRTADGSFASALTTIKENAVFSNGAATASRPRLHVSDRTKMDMTDVEQQLRRSLSIADPGHIPDERARTTKRSPTTESLLRAPPVSSISNLTASTRHATNFAAPEETRPKVSVSSPAGVVDSAGQGKNTIIIEALRKLETLETKNRLLISLTEQIGAVKDDINSITRELRAALDQGQILTTSGSHLALTAPPPSDGAPVAGRSTAPVEPTKESKVAIEVTGAPTSINPSTKRKIRAERRAETKQQMAKKKAAEEAADVIGPLKFSSIFLPEGQESREAYRTKCVRPYNWRIHPTPPSPPIETPERASSVQFPDSLFWTPSPSDPETIEPPHHGWTLGNFTHPNRPALTPRVLVLSGVPAARCTLRTLIAWFQLFGSLVYAEHAGSVTGTALLEYADPLGAYRAMLCTYPAWGVIGVRARYGSLMEVKGYGRGREKGRVTIPVHGIRAGTSASTSMRGARGVKRRKEETELEDGEIEAHLLGLPPPLPPPAPPAASTSGSGGGSGPKRQWVTKIIDGQEFIIVDDDDEDEDQDAALSVTLQSHFASRRKKQTRRRRPKGATRRHNAPKPEEMEVELPPAVQSDGTMMEMSDGEDEAAVENHLQLESDEDSDSLSTEEGEDLSGSERSTMSGTAAL